MVCELDNRDAGTPRRHWGRCRPAPSPRLAGCPLHVLLHHATFTSHLLTTPTSEFPQHFACPHHRRRHKPLNTIVSGLEAVRGPPLAAVHVSPEPLALGPPKMSLEH